MTEPRWLDEREQRAWRGYLAMQSRLQARLNRRLQDDSGLSLTDFDVLVALTDRDEVRMRVHELADTLQWERSRLSHQLSRMQRRGLIEREDCEDDARGAFVVLTAEGRRRSTGPRPRTSRPCASWCSTGSRRTRSTRSPGSRRSCWSGSAADRDDQVSSCFSRDATDVSVRCPSVLVTRSRRSSDGLRFARCSTTPAALVRRRIISSVDRP